MCNGQRFSAGKTFDEYVSENILTKDKILFSQVQKNEHCDWQARMKQDPIRVKGLGGEFQETGRHLGECQPKRYSTGQQQQNWPIQISCWQNSHHLGCFWRDLKHF